MAQVELRGAAELEKVLRQLPGKIGEQEVKKALRVGARIVQKRAKEILRSKVSEASTGALEKSIRVATVKNKIVIGFAKPTSRRAHITEYGTSRSKALPFMRPAIDEKGEEAIKAIGATLGKSVAKVAEELAGDFALISKRVKRQL